MEMTPTDRRLLLGVHRALADLQEAHSDPRSNYIVSAAVTLLEELVLRTDREFYVGYLKRGMTIFDELVPPLISTMTESDRAWFSQVRAGLERSTNQDGSLSSLDAGAQLLKDSFSRLVAYLPFNNIGAATDPVARLLNWEGEPIERAAAFTLPTLAEGCKPITVERLQNYLRMRFPERGELRVIEILPLIGGFQKLTIMFTIESAEGMREALVLRAEQPDKFLSLDCSEIADEYEVLKLVFDAGLPVAEPMWLETDVAPLGRRFLVTRKVDGVNLAHAAGAGERMSEADARSLVEALARVHRVPLEDWGGYIKHSKLKRWLEYPTLPENTLANVEMWLAQLQNRAAPASPAIAVVGKWLRENVPREDARACLIHCDFGPHNILVKNGSVSAILDWESARIGDPAEDLAHFIKSVGQHIDRAQILRQYEEASGIHISEFRLRYYDIVSNFKFLVACTSANILFSTDTEARNEWMILAQKWIYLATKPLVPSLAAVQGMSLPNGHN
jgi:aminoglycoside phosphotransferase (APT) family kinase protein